MLPVTLMCQSTRSYFSIDNLRRKNVTIKLHYVTNFNFLKVVFMKLTDLSQFEGAEFKNHNQKFLSASMFLQNSKQNYVIFAL